MAEIRLDKLAEHIGRSLEETARAVKLATFSGVIRDTRVDTGRLRGNWQCTVAAPASGELDRLDPTGATAISEVQRTVQPDTIDYLTNNLPYAEVWEERDGMVARNVARIERTIREKAR